MPYGITQCHLPPGRGDVPALVLGLGSYCTAVRGQRPLLISGGTSVRVGGIVQHSSLSVVFRGTGPACRVDGYLRALLIRSVHWMTRLSSVRVCVCAAAAAAANATSGWMSAAVQVRDQRRITLNALAAEKPNL